jgi:hypothetical protein
MVGGAAIFEIEKACLNINIMLCICQIAFLRAVYRRSPPGYEAKSLSKECFFANHFGYDGPGLSFGFFLKVSDNA